MKKKLKILITGPVAPPAGGISIHIQRLVHLLEGEFDIDLIDESSEKKDGIFNMKSLRLFAYLKKVRKADLLFVHSGNRLFKKIHILTGRMFAKKIIITIHGYGPKRSWPVRTLDNIIYSLSHKIILVNPDIANKLSLPCDKCIVKHAFLPPILADEPELLPGVVSWIKKARSKNEMIICGNASRLNIYNNQDLYGLDMSIEVTRRLIKKGILVSFVYTVSSLENCADIFKKNLQLINDLGMKDNFMLINERLSFVRLIEDSDIVLRPTNTDGDALTVREAIFLGKKVLASDVVERPAGTTLFRTRDIDDLEKKLEALVEEVRSPINFSQQGANNFKEDFKSFYINLINSVVLN